MHTYVHAFMHFCNKKCDRLFKVVVIHTYLHFMKVALKIEGRRIHGIPLMRSFFCDYLITRIKSEFNASTYVHSCI